VKTVRVLDTRQHYALTLKVMSHPSTISKACLLLGYELEHMDTG